MTRIEKTVGIVLGAYPVSETSTVFSWLTPDHGRMHTLAKGAQRPKGVFLSQVDLFYTVELLFYPRPATQLHLAKECTALKPRRELRRRYRCAAGASYLVDLLNRVSPKEAPDAGLYRLADYALDHLAERGLSESFFHWLEFRLMEHLGLAPRLNRCMACNKALPPAARDYVLSTNRGGLLCKNCSRRVPGGHVVVGADIVSLLLAWQQAKSPGEAMRVKPNPTQLEVLSKILGRFIEYHIDAPLPSRALALQILRAPEPRTAAG